MYSIVVISGNPKPDSKTTVVAQTLAARIADASEGPAAVTVIELAELGGAVLDRGDARAAAQRDVAEVHA